MQYKLLTNLLLIGPFSENRNIHMPITYKLAEGVLIKSQTINAAFETLCELMT
jgi:hypothetical protein